MTLGAVAFLVYASLVCRLLMQEKFRLLARANNVLPCVETQGFNPSSSSQLRHPRNEWEWIPDPSAHGPPSFVQTAVALLGIQPSSTAIAVARHWNKWHKRSPKVFSPIYSLNRIQAAKFPTYFELRKGF
jgi:hypothetical protein